MLNSLSSPRERFSGTQYPQQDIPVQNTGQNYISKPATSVKVDDYDFFTPLMSRRCKACKFLKIFYSNLKQDFSDYFKATFFFPLAAFSGTVMAVGGRYLSWCDLGRFSPQAHYPNTSGNSSGCSPWHCGRVGRGHNGSHCRHWYQIFHSNDKNRKNDPSRAFIGQLS